MIKLFAAINEETRQRINMASSASLGHGKQMFAKKSILRLDGKQN